MKKIKPIIFALLTFFVIVDCGDKGNPTQAATHYTMGVQYFEKKDYEKAIREFDEAIRLDKRSALSYYYRGEVYRIQKSYDRAIADYDQAIRFNKKNADAFFNRGEIYRSQKDYDRAIADFKETLRLDSNHVTAKTHIERIEKFGMNSFTDFRDGKKYITVKIDNRIWMAENLNYNANDSKCYDNEQANCDKYGMLYNFKTALNVCPPGWHLPSAKEWDALIDAVGIAVAGTKLKATRGWLADGNGTDNYGFSAFPGGFGSDGRFSNIGTIGFWWSATGNAYLMPRHTANVLFTDSDDSGLYYCSVRCVKDY